MNPDWRAEADARIAQHRQGNFVVTLHGPDGQPLRHVPVRIEQTRHAFHFGAAINRHAARTDIDGDRYRQIVCDHFSAVVSENDFKWYTTEKEPGRLDYAAADWQMEFAAQHRLALRGHCLFWAKPEFTQSWVQALTDAELRRALEARLDSIVPRYRGRLSAWDVNNEMLDGTFFADRLGPDINAWMFRRAHELDPATPLFVNEYGILDSDEKLGRYLDLIRDLRDRGAPLGGIGVQEHAAERFAGSVAQAVAEQDRPERHGRAALIPEDCWERLDRLAATGLPIHITEVSSKTTDQQRRAETLETLFRVMFAHPAVTAILVWGFWEKCHWLGADAALWDADWNALPAGARLSRLLREEWRTRTSAVTDAAGQVRFRGFYGTYELQAAGVTRTVELSPTKSPA